MTTTPIAPRRSAASPELEAVLAGLLAEVLHVESVSADSHFFDDLGADSLVMAHFCARVRKRGNLPRISMRDVYAHPTVRSLAAALGRPAARSAARPPAAPVEPPTPTSAREYVVCGALQAAAFLAYSYAAVAAIAEGYAWVSAGSSAVAIYLRLVVAWSAVFLAVCAVPIAAKWMLVGRWRPRRIRLWSLDYVRFWVVKTLVRSSPASRLFIGTPLYSLYLRALGAKIGPGAVIFSQRVPVCTDLLTVGARTVIRKEAMCNCYRAEAGRIETGPVTLGRDVFVGERSVLDIGTSMGDGAQLGHASALHTGQAVPKGEQWHGCPAQRTDVNYVRVPPAPLGRLRPLGYSVAAVLVVLLFYLPLTSAVATLGIEAASSVAAALAPGAGAVQGLVLEAAILSLLVFFGLALVGLLLFVASSRLLNRFLVPDRVYPLYGFHDAVHRAVARIGRLRFFPYLFGDSVYIVRYLQWLGFRLKPVEQTGSNFGSDVMHANPALSAVGTGTMVADGLVMVNDEVSSTSFRVSRTTIGPNNFVGNDVIYPAGGRTGGNCLLGIKVLVPLDGDVREGTGLLGSPSFPIPRTVERDHRFDHLRSGQELRRGLAAKTRYNIRTIGLFLLTRWASVFVFLLPYLAAVELFGEVPRALSAAFFALSVAATAVYLVLVHRGVDLLQPLRPTTCSIYHRDFWSEERHWKMHPIYFLHTFDGTPFKNMLWRLMGVRMGRRVFDDGTHISDATLTAIGDESVLNYKSKIQCHSQEDGTFKCDRSTLGARCTLGVGSFVLYGVTMSDGSRLATDSFLMKGEYVPPNARWAGNPAREEEI